MKDRLQLSLLLITHDLGVIAETADRVAVMYAGRIVEHGPVRAIFREPQHPYTRGLLASMPGAGARPAAARDRRHRCRCSARFPPGCAFHPRCPDRFEPCPAAAPPDYRRRHRTTARAATCTTRRQRLAADARIAPTRSPMPLVEVSHLVKQFTPRRRPVQPRHARSRAVDDVSFSIEEGETFGLVGESGSGKTTTGRCLLRLIEPTSGSVRFRGDDVLAFSRRRMREARRRHADRLSGSVFVAEPADAGAADRRGAADHPPARRREPSAARGSRNCSSWSASTRRTSSAFRTSSAAASGSGSGWRARWR